MRVTAVFQDRFSIITDDKRRLMTSSSMTTARLPSRTLRSLTVTDSQEAKQQTNRRLAHARERKGTCMLMVRGCRYGGGHRNDPRRRSRGLDPCLHVCKRLAIISRLLLTPSSLSKMRQIVVISHSAGILALFSFSHFLSRTQ